MSKGTSYVGYLSMAKESKRIRTYAREFNNELELMYNSIIEMNKSWNGVRYNNFVNKFNTKIKNTLNGYTEFIVCKVPYTLERIANVFANADGVGNTTSAELSNYKKLPIIPLHDDNELKFIESDVIEQQEAFSKHLINAICKVEEIDIAYKKILWKSDGAKLFYGHFIKRKNEIIRELNNLNDIFTKEMANVRDDYNKSEKANKNI